MPAPSVQPYAEQALFGVTLADKLTAWPEVDVRQGRRHTRPLLPGRPPELALPTSHRKLPSVWKEDLQANDGRARVLHELANHELQAIELIEKACQKEGISMIEASYRWLLRHSALRPEMDGILLGASSLAQLDENLASCTAAAEKGPLSDELLAAFDEGWKLTKDGAFPYWRSYSSDFPNRESLDPGASYTVKK